MPEEVFVVSGWEAAALLAEPMRFVCEPKGSPLRGRYVMLAGDSGPTDHLVQQLLPHVQPVPTGKLFAVCIVMPRRISSCIMQNLEYLRTEVAAERQKEVHVFKVMQLLDDMWPDGVSKPALHSATTMPPAVREVLGDAMATIASQLMGIEFHRRS